MNKPRMVTLYCPNFHNGPGHGEAIVPEPGHLLGEINIECVACHAPAHSYVEHPKRPYEAPRVMEDLPMESSSLTCSGGNKSEGACDDPLRS